jgi:acyl carrier protein
MNNLDLYKKVFIDAFSLSDTSDVENLEYNAIMEWDSVGHMGLIAELEEAFSIQMDMNDVIDFGSFEKGKEILLKYNIDLK